MKATAFLAAFLMLAAARGAEPLPLMTITGKTLVSEDFDGAAIPPTFRTLRTPGSFRVADGALDLVSKPGQEHATHGAFMVRARDLTITFSVKFLNPGTVYVGVDGYKEEFQGNTHLVLFSLTPERVAWDQHRGGPESKRAVGEAAKAARAAKQPVPKATAEQLADPTFFRIEELAAKPIVCGVGDWHRVLLEVNGNDLVAQVDGQALLAVSTVADATKNRIGVGLTGRATVLIDNVRVWENSRRADWEQVKASLALSARAHRAAPEERLHPTPVHGR
jgi:hypothetical protein